MQDLCNELSKYNALPNHYYKSTTMPTLNSSDYECVESVKTRFHTLRYGVEYIGHIHACEIRIRFFTKTKDDCIHRYQIVMTILRFMLAYTSIPTINIDFLFTDVKKTLPPKNEFIGQDTLNTGYTIGNLIVVYREEEWLKVFIHECMHLFEYDGILRDKSKLIYPLFPVNKNIHLNESYSEIWARILNCCIISVVNDIPVKKLLAKESEFSKQQMSKILTHMNLTYQDLFQPTTVFHEKTNAFAYIVLGAILMDRPYDFIHWCKLHNKPLIKIVDANAYVKYIEQHCKSPKLFKVIPSTNNFTNMTINNIQL
jgi:hypothetical protein